jgi:hypothetical protein
MTHVRAVRTGMTFLAWQIWRLTPLGWTIEECCQTRAATKSTTG